MPSSVKNLLLESRTTGNRAGDFIPCLYIESKIDLKDVRTGFRETYNIGRVYKLPGSRVEPVWEDDLLLDVAARKMRSARADEVRPESLPEYLDGSYLAWMESRFLQYLLRSFTVKVLRNFHLAAYSRSGESRNDFIVRCTELVRERVLREFDDLFQVFKRKLERLRYKYMEVEQPEELEKYRSESRSRDLFGRVSDGISEIFLQTEFSIQHVLLKFEPVSRMNELEERLQSLYLEAQEAAAKTLDTYEDQAKSVDEYILHPAMKDIHYVSGAVLWMPEGAV